MGLEKVKQIDKEWKKEKNRNKNEAQTSKKVENRKNGVRKRKTKSERKSWKKPKSEWKENDARCVVELVTYFTLIPEIGVRAQM